MNYIYGLCLCAYFCLLRDGGCSRTTAGVQKCCTVQQSVRILCLQRAMSQANMHSVQRMRLQRRLRVRAGLFSCRCEVQMTYFAVMELVQLSAFFCSYHQHHNDLFIDLPTTSCILIVS